MAITDVLEKTSIGSSLKKLIDKYLESERTQKYMTSDSYTRASGFAEMCPRQEVLCNQLKLDHNETIETDLQLIFDHGTALHWGLQNLVLPKTGALLGKWKCLQCDKVHGTAETESSWLENIIPKPDRCDCGRDSFIYVEGQFVNHEYRIGGHPDGYLTLPGQPGIGIFEAKSIGTRGFWEVKDFPLLAHYIQVHAYFLLTGLTWARILYWDKAGHGISALQEHHVELMPDIMAQIKSTLMELKVGLATGALPARICDTIDCPKAKKCNVKKQCFEAPNKLVAVGVADE